MKAKLYQQDGTVKGEVDLPDDVFAADVNEHLIFQVVKGYLANARQGNSKTKGRAEVSGGGRRPWRQKGTGRARAGSNTSPIWARGGKAFGPDPRDYYARIPRKMRKLALKMALSSRAKDAKIIVVDKITCEQPRTKEVIALLNALSLGGRKNLLVVNGDNHNLYLSARNIRDLEIKPISEINAYDILHSENIIFGDEQLIGKVEEAVAL